MDMWRRHSLWAGLALACMATPGLAGVVPGHVDSFEDGTTQGWRIGPVAPDVAWPVNVADGGPGGAGDNHLRLTSVGGSGAASRLTAFNTGSAWQGDYLALGVDAIRLDAINLGNSDLALRLLLSNPGGGPPTDLAFSTVALTLPAGSGWTRLTFSLDPADLSAALGSVAGALSDVTSLRIFHSTRAEFPGDALTASLGLDNITAVGTGAPPPNPVSAPGSGLLAVAALWALHAARRRRASAPNGPFS